MLRTARSSVPPACVSIATISSANEWPAAAHLDAGLLDLARGLSRKGSGLFARHKLHFPKKTRELDDDRATQLALRSYGLMPTSRPKLPRR